MSGEREAEIKQAVPDPLIIRELKFIGGMASAGGWRPEVELPEVAFCGRSNVGKSSLLNKLVRRKAFARVSKTPGRTREINFFQVNDQFILVDLPGYGYAKIAKEKKAEWRPLIEQYLKYSRSLRGIVQLLDARRDPTEDDIAMLDFLADRGVPTIVAVTKVDKYSRAAAVGRVKELAIQLHLDDDQIIPFSSVTGQGRDELATAVVELISMPAPVREPEEGEDGATRKSDENEDEEVDIYNRERNDGERDA